MIKPGDMLLMQLPTIGGGAAKLRPVLMLATLPGPYQNLLICGVSSQLQLQEPDWDELIEPGDSDFNGSGLHGRSVIRLSYLYGAGLSEIAGKIGSVDPARLERLLRRLSEHLSA